jgi:hypothetical protein
MTVPALLFGMLISTLYGALFHLWRGGGVGRLILYLILGWAGFWIGQALANQLNWTFGSLGTLRLGMATLTSALFLGIGYWLSLVEVDRK